MEPNNFFDGQNKFMYVNQALLQSLKQNQSKVLINPNFVNQMGIKPHFNKHFFTNQTIHVNPNVIRNYEKSTMKQPVMEKMVTKSNIIVSTPTKIIRSPKAIENSRIRRTSIHTKYKIIRGTPTIIKRVSNSLPARHKNTFTIDRRLSGKKIPSSKNINIYVKRNLSKCNYVRINNVTNKKINETKVRGNVKPQSGALKSKILMIRGHKYKLDSSHHTLTLMNNKCNNRSPKSLFKTIYVGGMTFKQKERNVFVKTKVRQQHMLLRQARQKSLNILTNKHKKSNLPCPMYRKFGKCKGKETGRCIRIHNPEQISLCSKFIQGACTNKYCLLSHKISAEKMPTCKFFLDGLCLKDDCPYLHVKISNKAEICKDFLEGFCKKAAECDKRHQYLCSDFEKTGKCVKKTCPYPHGNVVRAPKFTKLIIKKLQGECKGKKIESKTDIEVKNVEEKSLNVRYYNETQNSSMNAESPSDENLKSRKRPKLGSLPSFIPFNESQES